MALFSRGPHEYWLKPHFSKNEVAKSGYITKSHSRAVQRLCGKSRRDGKRKHAHRGGQCPCRHAYGLISNYVTSPSPPVVVFCNDKTKSTCLSE